MVVGTLSSLGVLNWSLHNIKDVCTDAAPNGFTCPFSKTHFNTSLIWGAIGPRRYFQSEIGYSSLLYFFLIGAILPVPVYILSRRYPNSMWKRVHIPLFLGGLNYLPPATGMNYGSWAIIGLIFSWFIRKRLHAWWSKYNFVLSSALDSSVSVAGVLIFLTIFFTGASKHFKWWGTDVYKVREQTSYSCCYS
jgi:OPT family oligopeptide transporter